MALTMQGERYDIIVAGGGSAGVAAAVGAAETGARVLLVETYGFLGGAATHSLVLAWCGFYPQRPAPRPAAIVGGVAIRVLSELSGLGIDVQPYYSPTGNWNVRLNPEATKIALDRTVRHPGLTVALHTRIIGAALNGDRLTAVRLADHRGIREVAATAFVDCTGEADLAFLAGATPCPLHAANHGRQPASRAPFRRCARCPLRQGSPRRRRRKGRAEAWPRRTPGGWRLYDRPAGNR